MAIDAWQACCMGVLFVGCLVLIGHLLHTYVAISRRACDAFTFDVIDGVRTSVLFVFGPAGTGDALDAKVRNGIDRERGKCLKRATALFDHFFGLWLVLLLVNTFTDLKDGAWDEEPSEVRTSHLVLKLGSLADCLTGLFATKFLLLCPQPHMSRALSLMYGLFCFVQGAKCVSVLHFSDVLAWKVTRPGSLQLLFGLVVCNKRVVNPCNVLLWAVESVMIWRSYLDESPLMDRSALLMSNTGSVLVIILAITFFEHAVWEVGRFVMLFKAASKTEVTVQRLLSALCDAVVTLGPDLRISKKAPKLANLLLHGNPARALEGSHFLDLLVEGDQVRFNSLLEHIPETTMEPASDPEPAQAMNISLRDSTGTKIPVQIFHSHFQDENDEIGHLIGICEVGDSRIRQAAQQVAQQVAQQGLAQQGQQSEGNSRSYSDLSSDLSLVGDSVSQSFSETQRHPHTSGPLRPVEEQEEQTPWAPWQKAQQEDGDGCMVSFDVLRFAIMQQQSATPVIDANLLELESLQQWVAEWKSLKAWLEDIVNAALRPINASRWPAGSSPPSSVRFQCSFRGMCMLPKDLLQRSLTPNPNQQASSGGSSSGSPLRVSVDRVRLVRSHQQRRPAGTLRGRRHHQHAPVQPALIGNSHPTLQTGASSSTPRGPSSQPPARRRDIRTVNEDDGVEGRHIAADDAPCTGVASL